MFRKKKCNQIYFIHSFHKRNSFVIQPYNRQHRRHFETSIPPSFVTGYNEFSKHDICLKGSNFARLKSHVSILTGDANLSHFQDRSSLYQHLIYKYNKINQAFPRRLEVTLIYPGEMTFILWLQLLQRKSVSCTHLGQTDIIIYNTQHDLTV